MHVFDHSVFDFAVFDAEEPAEAEGGNLITATIRGETTIAIPSRGDKIVTPDQ